MLPVPALLAVAFSAIAGDPSPAPAGDLAARIAALREQIRGQRAAEARTLIREVLSDAGTRAGLLRGGGHAGYERGFLVASPDGAFRICMNGRRQRRFVYNHQDQGSGGADRWGFESRRIRLGFRGYVGDPSWAGTAKRSPCACC